MKTFKTTKGTDLPLMNIHGKDYLTVQNRLIWFREEHPLWGIKSRIIEHSPTHAIFEASIEDETGRTLSTGYKYENKAGFGDFLEKAQSGAIGRALGFLGYGTQFALDLEEGDRLADSPVEKKSTQTSHSVRDLTSSNSVRVSTNTPKEPLFPKDENDIENYIVTFGKYRDRRIGDIMMSESPQKVLQYCEWLEQDAASKRKPLGESAQDFIHAARAYVEEMDIPKNEDLGEKLKRLKNDFPPVDEEPWPEHP